MTSLYDFKVTKMDGTTTTLEEYKGKVLLIVNTASKCGFTKQFDGLEKLYDTYNAQGFTILGFPCNQFKAQDPGTNEEIQEFCRLNYGVTFPMYQKVEVNGENADPLYHYLKAETGGKDISWNFEKFLIDQEGTIVKRYLPIKTPKGIEPRIKEMLEVN